MLAASGAMVAPMDVNRGLVVHCVEDICLSPLNSERSTAAVALDFYSSLDAKGKDILGNRLCKARGRFCEEFIKFCRLRSPAGSRSAPGYFKNVFASE